MDELAAWLRHELDEDEAEARYALDHPDGSQSAPGDPGLTWVLADVAAKRAILDLHTGDFPYNPDDGPGDFAWTEQCKECGDSTPCPTVRLLASPYADRPGYRPQWSLQ